MVKVMRRGAPVLGGGIVVFHYPGLVVLFSKSITFLGGDFKLIYSKDWGKILLAFFLVYKMNFVSKYIKLDTSCYIYGTENSIIL